MKTLDPDALLGAPALPPKEWFEELPEWFDPDGPVIQVSTDGDDVGRVAVIVAPRNECLLDGTRDCWTAPESPSDYAWAHVGVTVTEDGTEVPTANIGGAVNHDTGQRGFDAAADHYANTATRLMRVAYFDAPDAVMAVGSMEPDVTVWDVLSAKASAVSGHWQPNPKAGNKVDFAGSQLVNNPGFRRTPKRASLTYVASLDGSDVSGVWATAKPEVSAGVEPAEDVAATAAQTQSTNAKENLVETKTTPCACEAQTETDPLAALTAQVEALAVKVAAYEVVEGPSFTQSEQVELPDGSFGSVDSWSTMTTADGVEMVQVTPEVNGELVEADAVLYPVDQLVRTGKRYQWVSSDDRDNDVIQASIVTAATVTSDELDALSARVDEAMSALTARVDEIEASVAELIIGDAPDMEADSE